MTESTKVPILSVVIPTRDRRNRLVETLQALAGQKDVAGNFEVIVVDDGSQDDTGNLLAQLRPETFTLHPLRQGPAGPATARNRGIALARAPRVLLLGDDTRPAPDCLARHLDIAREAENHAMEVGVQGHIDWDPEHQCTPLMDFLAPAGPQFYFAALSPGEPIPYTALLGSNASAPTHWFHREPYDESFPHAAFEDTELGYRWQRHGWRSLYAADALCWHHHHYDTIEPFLERQTRAGIAAAYALRKHPAMLTQVALLPTLTGARNLLRHTFRRLTGRARQSDAWDLACRRAFLRGLLPFRRP